MRISQFARAAALLAALSIPASSPAQAGLPPGTTAPGDQPRPSTPSSLSNSLDAAEDKIAQGDFTAGRPLVEKVLAAHPADARALFDLGYLEQRAGRNDQAKDDYRRAIASDPKQFESRLALGLMLASQGNQDEARNQLTAATQLTPAPPNLAAKAQAYRALAALERTSHPRLARDALLSALKLTPATPEDLLLTGQIAEANNDIPAAEAAYRRLLGAQTPHALISEAASGLVHLLLEQKKYAEAEEMAKMALSGEPGSASLQAQLVTSLIDQGKNAEALPALKTLGQMQPGNLSVERMLADAYSDAGRPEDAAPIYAQLAQAEPNDEGILAEQGRNFVRGRKYLEAQPILERALQLKPDDGGAWNSLAFAAFQNKQYAVALKALDERANYLPETAVSYFLRAASFDDLRQKDGAMQYYQKFLEADQGKLPDQEWQARQRLKVLKSER